MDKLRMETPDLTQRNIEKIATLFPHVITEARDEHGKLRKAIDFVRLKQELSPDVIEGEESYEFTWVGKKAAMVEANTPIRKTLRPCIKESKDWETTANLYLEGDNLDVLKMLQESCLKSVKLIYIDPPYNTGKDFIYRDSFTVAKEDYEEQLGLFDEQQNRLFRNSDSNGRFHSDWCSMMYPRLKLAHTLLTDDGVLFVSVDNNELGSLIKICDEVFGESNFIAQIVHKNNSMKNQTKLIGVTTEYILCYAKNKTNMTNVSWRIPKKGARDIAVKFSELQKKGLPLVEIEAEIKEMYSRPKYAHLSRWNKVDEKGVFKDADLSRENGPKSYTIVNPHTGKECVVPRRGWGKSYEELLRLQQEDMIWYGDDTTPPGLKDYIDAEDVMVPDNFWYFDNSVDTRWVKQIFGSLIFENPKPLEMIKQLLMLHSTAEDIVLDFFSGSATTAHAVMELNAEDGGNRKFIMVQLREPCSEDSEAFKAGYKTIADIGKERIRRAGEKIKTANKDKEGIEKLDIGFRVFKVDSTNMKDVFYAANEYDQQMLAGLESNIKEDRTELDLLFGVLLEWGLPLSLKHKEEKIDGVTVHTVDEGSLIACFAERVPEAVVREIAKRQPLRAVFRDSSFASSAEKINVQEIFKLLAPNTSVRVL